MTRTEIIRQDVPAPLLVCESDPEIPDGVMTDREIAAYLLDLWVAHQDCFGKLGAVRRVIKGGK